MYKLALGNRSFGGLRDESSSIPKILILAISTKTPDNILFSKFLNGNFQLGISFGYLQTCRK